MWRRGVRLDVAFLDERDAVPRVVVPVARADVSARAGPGRADVREARSRLRVVDRALRSLHVASPAAAPARVDGERPVSPRHVTAPPASLAAVPRSNVSPPDAPVTGTRNLAGDHVDESANGIRP